MRRLGRLRHDVEVPGAGAGVGGHRPDLDWLEPEFVRGAACGVLRPGIAAPPPRDERAAERQERCRVLNHDVQRGECTGGDEVVRAETVLPRLGTGVDDRRVSRFAPGHGSLQESALPSRALYERDASLGQRDRQWQAGDTWTCAEIGERGGALNLLELERDQRIGKVIVDDLERLADRRWGERVVGEHVKQRAKAAHRGFRQPVARPQPSEPTVELRRSRTAGHADYSEDPSRARSRAMYAE